MSNPAVIPLVGFGAQEMVLIVIVILLLFGAKKLPELARGSGRALRIFKAETKGLIDDDDEQKTEEQKQIDAQRPTPGPAPEVHQVDTPVERPGSETDR